MRVVNATVHGGIPSFTVLFAELSRYLRRGFHPTRPTAMDPALRFQAVVSLVADA